MNPQHHPSPLTVRQTNGQPNGLPNGKTCSGQDGAHQLLCLIANPYAAHVSFPHTAAGKSTNPTWCPVQRDRLLGCPGIFIRSNDPDHCSILSHATP